MFTEFTLFACSGCRDSNKGSCVSCSTGIVTAVFNVALFFAGRVGLRIKDFSPQQTKDADVFATEHWLPKKDIYTQLYRYSPRENKLLP